MWITNIIQFLKDKSYRTLSISTLIVLLNGTFIYHFVEHLKWIDALYFSVITLTTVGYGDISPQTNFGKIFTIFYIITGIGIIFGFMDAFYKHRTKQREDAIEARKTAKLNKNNERRAQS